MRKYIDILSINLIYLIIGIVLFYVLDKRVEILVAVIATGITLSLGIRQYKTENDKIFKALFNEFNAKYDTKFNEKLGTIIKKYESNELDKLDDVIIIDYLNFCAEEYLWKTKGRIPEPVWNSWENGMIYYFSNPLIRGIFDKEGKQKKSYYGLYERLEKKLPVTCNKHC